MAYLASKFLALTILVDWTVEQIVGLHVGGWEKNGSQNKAIVHQAEQGQA